jgi:hypothetical protein
MSDGFRRMPFATKVNSFQREIGGHESFMAGGNSQHGAIITDSSDNAAALWKLPAQPRNQSFFCKRHDESTIAV